MLYLKIASYSIFSIVGVLLIVALVQAIFILNNVKCISDRLKLLTDIKGWLTLLRKLPSKSK